jgi:hypothetical protein
VAVRSNIRRIEASNTGGSLHHCRDPGVNNQIGGDVGHFALKRRDRLGGLLHEYERAA